MADSSVLGGGGSSFMQEFLQNAQIQQTQQQIETQSDTARDDSVQAELQKKAIAHKQQVQQQQQSGQARRELYASDEKTDQRWKSVQAGSSGPELMQLANSADLQNKLTGKLKEMMLNASDTRPAEAARAAGELQQLAKTQTFATLAPTGREVTDLGAQLLERPGLAGNLAEAMGHPYMSGGNADTQARQGLLRFATRAGDAAFGTEISPKEGANVLNRMRSANVPGFGQRAGMQMMARDPKNLEGAKNLDTFVHEPAVRAMPAMARGKATEVLAKGDGKADLKNSLTDVAESGSFRSMGRAQKAQLFQTIQQGRPSQLRAITDQTLVALRSSHFATGQQQVGQFLRGLGRSIQKGDGSAKAVDGESLARQARRGGMPSPPKLISLADMSDEDAQAARSANRSALMGYYGKLQRHYGELEQRIDGAKYFEQVNQTTGLKEAGEPDLSALQVRDSVRQKIDQQLDSLPKAGIGRARVGPQARQAIKQAQANAFAEPDWTDDEKSYAYARLAQADASANFLQLAEKKGRKAREVSRQFMSPKLRKRMAQRAAQDTRPTGTQTPYVRAKGLAATAGRLPTASATAAAPRSQVAATATGGAGPRAAVAMNAAGVRAEVASLMQKLDPNLSHRELFQQANEMMAVRLQDHARALSQEMGQQLMSLVSATDASRPTAASVAPAAKKTPITSGQTDAYGIPRTQERDLGARRAFVAVRAPKTKPAAAAASGAAHAESEEEISPTASHRPMVKSSTLIRPVSELYTLKSLKDMNSGESALFRNLGWNAATWGSKNEPNAPLPRAYATLFADLSSTQKEAVRKLGLTAADWDATAIPLKEANKV